MSYVIHVWQRPLPGTLAEANILHTQLSKTRGAAPDVFKVFAAHVRRAATAALGSAAADIDGIEHDRFTSPVLNLGLPTRWLAPLQALVAREALALGLVLFDAQAGTCLHPNGHLLTADGHQPLPLEDWAPLPLPTASAAVPPTRHSRALVPTEAILTWRAERAAQPSFQEASSARRVGEIDPRPIDGPWVQGRATQQLLPWLRQHGFEDLTESDETSFKRMTPAGLQTLQLRFQDLTGGTGSAGTVLRLAYRLEPWLPASLQACISSDGGGPIPLEPPPHQALAWAAPEANHGTASTTTCHVRNRGELELLLRGLREVLRQEVFPLFDACRTPAGILACVRQTQELPAALRHATAVVALAHWAGAPDFHALLLSQWRRAMRADAVSNAYLRAAQGLRAQPGLFGAMPQAQRAG